MAGSSDKELILEWLEWFEHNKGRAAGSVNKYMTYLQNLSAFLEQRGKTLPQASRRDLEEFTGIEAHKAGMSPRSRRPLVAAVRGFYKWAETQWYIKSNPAETLPYPSTGRRLPKPMTLRNAEKLIMQPDLDEFTGVRDAAIMSVFIGCGLRLSGLAKMNRSSLVFAPDDRGVEWLFVRVVEKGDRERFVPAPHETRLLVSAYLGHGYLRTIDRTLPDGDEILWASVNNRLVPEHEYAGENRRMAERSISDMIIKHGTAAGIPRSECHPHAMRHLYGTELTEDDVQQRKIQVLLGHSDMKSTQIYQHVAVRGLMKAVQKSNPLAKIHTPVTGLVEHITSR